MPLQKRYMNNIRVQSGLLRLMSERWLKERTVDPKAPAQETSDLISG